MAIIHNLIARFRADTGTFDRNVKKSRSEMTRFGRDVQKMGKQLLMLAGIGGGLYAVKRGMEAITKAVIIQERAERDLIAAVGGSIDTFKTYASELQRLTVYGDEQILSQMAYARNLGVTTDKLKEAAKAAIGLAARFRIDLSSAMMLVGRASQGQTQLLTRYGIVIDQTLSDQDKFNKLLKIGADSFRLAEEEAKTIEGTFTQLKNSAGDLAEYFGGPFVKKFAAGTKAIIDFGEEIKRIAKEQEDMTFPFMVPPKEFFDITGKAAQAQKELDEWNAFQDKWSKKNAKDLSQIKSQENAYKQAEKISKSYLDSINLEIELTGRVGEARQHAAMMIKMQNKLQEEGIENTNAGKKAVGDLSKALTRLEKAQKLGRIAEDIGSSFASAFEDMIFEAKKFGDVMKSLLRDISRSVLRNLVTQPMANSITMALGGTPATIMHGGGIVGSVGRKRNVPAFAFAGAPKLHNGLMNDEYPAILQRGEQVIPRGEGMTAPQINIYNESGTQIKQKNQPTFDGKKWVISVVAEDYNSGGTLRKLFKQ